MSSEGRRVLTYVGCVYALMFLAGAAIFVLAPKDGARARVCEAAGGAIILQGMKQVCVARAY